MLVLKAGDLMIFHSTVKVLVVEQFEIGYNYIEIFGTDDLLIEHPIGYGSMGDVVTCPRAQYNLETQIHKLEQKAYSSVLQAFKAQSDSLTWEKESLITQLRVELRVSDAEHREILTMVNANYVIRNIRELMQSGQRISGLMNPLPSSSISGSRKRKSTNQSVPSLSLNAPSVAMQSRPIGASMQPSSLETAHGTTGAIGKKTELIPSTAPSGRSQFTTMCASGVLAANELAETKAFYPLIDRKIVIGWLEDKKFEAAAISDYDPQKINMNEYFSITFKFGGYWSKVKSQKKYEGGNQKIVKLMKYIISFMGLRDEIEAICPWLRGHAYELHYHVFETSPKEYKLFSSDADVIEMIKHSNGKNIAEVVVVMQDDIEDVMYSQNAEIMDSSHMLEMYYSSSDCDDDNNIVVDAMDDRFLISQSSDAKGLFVGSRYHDSQSFKHALRTEAILNNFAIKIKVSDRKRVIANCAHSGCPWRIRASLCADDQTFEVRKLDAPHLCPGVNIIGNKQATTSWVAHQIEGIVRKNPDIPPKQINDNLETMYGLSLPYMKLWRSREQAREIIFGSFEDNYKWVPTLKSELVSRNPGSHITYTYDIVDNSFKRFYVSFKVCSDGFLAGCRHLIGVDACHLRSKYLGVLLSANSLDGNNDLFTIAFAIVESESEKTWQWFFRNLVVTLGCEIDHLAFISNMEKGLGEAIKNIFPNAEHRICMQHLWKNMKKYFHYNDVQKVQTLVWEAASAYTHHDFECKMTELLHVCPQVHSYLLALPYKWSKHDFSTHIKNHYNTNNMSESFNAWIGDTLEKPVVDLIDMIRGMIMDQRAKRKLNSASWKGELVPHVEDYIREITSSKDLFIIKQSTSSRAEIEGNCARHEVDIEKRSCSCRFWQITGLPCIHAVAFIGNKQHPLWHTYIDEHYYSIRYRMAYEGAISTLPGKNEWNFVYDGVEIGVPNTLRPRGRSRKRIKKFLAIKNKKSRNSHKCSRCGLCGHHRSTCKNPLGQLCPELPDVDCNPSFFLQPFDNVGARAKLTVRREGWG